jgi:hypothetical protein
MRLFNHVKDVVPAGIVGVVLIVGTFRTLKIAFAISVVQYFV